jgi:hypothetical protein
MTEATKDRQTPCSRSEWQADPRERRSARKKFLRYIERVGSNETFERILVPLEDEQPEVQQAELQTA